MWSKRKRVDPPRADYAKIAELERELGIGQPDPPKSTWPAVPKPAKTEERLVQSPSTGAWYYKNVETVEPPNPVVMNGLAYLFGQQLPETVNPNTALLAKLQYEYHRTPDPAQRETLWTQMLRISGCKER